MNDYAATDVADSRRQQRELLGVRLLVSPPRGKNLTVQVWKRDPSESGRIRVLGVTGMFLYVVRSPQTACTHSKVGIGHLSRLRQWETRRWQVQQFAHWPESDNSEPSRIEGLVKNTICTLGRADWPYPYSGWQEAWLTSWGAIDVAELISGGIQQGIPDDLIELAQAHRRSIMG